MKAITAVVTLLIAFILIAAGYNLASSLAEKGEDTINNSKDPISTGNLSYFSSSRGFEFQKSFISCEDMVKYDCKL